MKLPTVVAMHDRVGCPLGPWRETAHDWLRCRLKAGFTEQAAGSERPGMPRAVASRPEGLAVASSAKPTISLHRAQR
jgi:hypothetical protein